MADETNHLLKRLTLTGAEGEEVSFGIKDEFSVQLGSENWAVGKLITDVAFNRDALVRVFKNVWYTDDEKDYEPSFSPRDNDFSLVPFWIRFYNVPLGWMNRLAERGSRRGDGY
ncbi:hypothetical protein PVK06_038565 [Gossypium arboreum]|uniref:DUF4283 domain-containing protein n=1 Tax=Gossypium arboreum TaxID=29729 RepID=A0ABR0N2I4_GOSAR|nr:hypothetical protein PVK06_038565 [Gossypium arboreum]